MPWMTPLAHHLFVELSDSDHLENDLLPPSLASRDFSAVDQR